MDKRTKLGNIIFLVAYVIFQISWMCEEISIIGQIKPFLTRAVIVLLFINMAIKKYTKKEIIIDFIIIILTILSMYKTKSTILFINIIFLLAFKNMDFDKLVKFDIKLKTVLILLVIGFYFMGLTNEGEFYRSNGDIRYSLGFQHPNLLGAYVFSICVEYVYLKYSKLKSIHYIIMIVLTIIVELITDSRSAIIGMTLLIVLTLVSKLLHNKIYEIKFIKQIFIYFSVVMLILSIFLAISFETKSKMIMYLDNISSGRIRCMHDFLYYYDTTLLGNELTDLGDYEKNLATLDNAYIYYLVQNGVIFLSFLIFGVIQVNRRSLKKQKYELLIALTTYTVYGIAETHFGLVQINIFLFYMAFLIYKSRQNDTIDDTIKLIGDSNENKQINNSNSANI